MDDRGMRQKTRSPGSAGPPTTRRQQARSLYGKAGVAGRAELSAGFLEDLLLPAETREA